MIKMRTHCDCMVACLAMLMDWTYDEAADYFPPKAVKETGYRWIWLRPYLQSHNIYLVWFGVCFREITEVDWKKPAIVNVPSLTDYEGNHMIFWDGTKVIDPIGYGVKYEALPHDILNVYQLKE